VAATPLKASTRAAKEKHPWTSARRVQGKPIFIVHTVSSDKAVLSQKAATASSIGKVASSNGVQ
jgi:hypothetical protein